MFKIMDQFENESIEYEQCSQLLLEIPWLWDLPAAVSLVHKL